MKKFSGLARGCGFLFVNLWLAYHVFAVFIAPAGMPPASPLLVDVSRIARPYNQALFLNHGYHFFAPDPGPSTLIEYRINRPDDIPFQGRFPDTATVPRLLYHRYFMLAENVGAFPETTQERVLEAYARHLCELHDTDAITLSRISHTPSSISRIQAGGRLSDPETYVRDEIGRYEFGQESSRTSTASSVVDAY